MRKITKMADGYLRTYLNVRNGGCAEKYGVHDGRLPVGIGRWGWGGALSDPENCCGGLPETSVELDPV